MANRDFINLRPVSNSDLICVTCGHVFDPNYKICTCISTQEWGEDGGGVAIRKVIPFKQYIQEKYHGK